MHFLQLTLLISMPTAYKTYSRIHIQAFLQINWVWLRMCVKLHGPSYITCEAVTHLSVSSYCLKVEKGSSKTWLGTSHKNSDCVRVGLYRMKIISHPDVLCLCTQKISIILCICYSWTVYTWWISTFVLYDYLLHPTGAVTTMWVPVYFNETFHLGVIFNGKLEVSDTSIGSNGLYSIKCYLWKVRSLANQTAPR